MMLPDINAHNSPMDISLKIWKYTFVKVCFFVNNGAFKNMTLPINPKEDIQVMSSAVLVIESLFF